MGDITTVVTLLIGGLVERDKRCDKKCISNKTSGLRRLSKIWRLTLTLCKTNYFSCYYVFLDYREEEDDSLCLLSSSVITTLCNLYGPDLKI